MLRPEHPAVLIACGVAPRTGQRINAAFWRRWLPSRGGGVGWWTLTTANEISGAPALRVRGVRKAYAGREVLCGVDFDLFSGERLALLGPSGSGKSTLLNCLGGVDRPDAGVIEAAGVNLAALKPDALAHWRRTGAGYVFQFFHLLPTLTAAENVELPLQIAGGWSPSKRAARVRELMERAGVAHRASAFPSELSGGERQRVAIARALAPAPKLILADEPTGNLDVANGEKVLGLLVEMASDAALVMATHSEAAAAVCHRRIQLLDGRVVGDGPVKA
jgi:putative ABC transport system ATP-binding protein